MTPTHKHRNICIAINLIAVAFLLNERADLGSILLLAGLMKFETYVLAKQYDAREIEVQKDLDLKHSWVKHHQRTVELQLAKVHSMEDTIEHLKNKLKKE